MSPFMFGKTRGIVVVTLLVVLSATLFSPRTTAAPKASTEQALQLQKRLLAAMVAADWKTTEDMMSDNLVYIHPSGVVNTKQQRMEAFRKGPSPAFTSIESKDVHAQVFNDTAVVTSETVFIPVSAPGSTQIRMLDLRFTTVWANEKGTWRMILWQCTTMPSSS